MGSYDTASGSRVLSTYIAKKLLYAAIKRYDTASGSRVLSTFKDENGLCCESKLRYRKR